jgi:hypothetical protein
LVKPGAFSGMNALSQTEIVFTVQSLASGGNRVDGAA